jgi:hypothetical protein
MKKRKANLNDGCNPELVFGADFDGILEIPVIHAPRTISIPDGITPFSRRETAVGTNEAIGHFEKDPTFADILINPSSYLEDLSRFKYVLPIDASLYRDAPLAVQVINLYRSRAIGSYFQRKGINIIPLVRWGNEYTYTTKYFPEKIAFLGIEKNSIIAISTYGCIKTKEDKYHFSSGLYEMLSTLEPNVVLVHGSMPDTVFKDYLNDCTFVKYPDWISRMRGGDD